MFQIEVVGRIKTYFMFNISKYFSKIVSKCRKIWWSKRGHNLSRNMAHTFCMLNKQGYMHARVFTWPRARTQARQSADARANTHTHKHTQTCNIYSFPRHLWLSGRNSMLLYTHTLCLAWMLLLRAAFLVTRCLKWHFVSEMLLTMPGGLWRVTKLVQGCRTRCATQGPHSSASAHGKSMNSFPTVP